MTLVTPCHCLSWLSQLEDGTYQFGALGPYKVAQLRGRLMVRLTNSWDTLEHVLLSAKPKVGPLGLRW